MELTYVYCLLFGCYWLNQLAVKKILFWLLACIGSFSNDTVIRCLGNQIVAFQTIHTVTQSITLSSYLIQTIQTKS